MSEEVPSRKDKEHELRKLARKKDNRVLDVLFRYLGDAALDSAWERLTGRHREEFRGVISVRKVLEDRDWPGQTYHDRPYHYQAYSPCGMVRHEMYADTREEAIKELRQTYPNAIIRGNKRAP